MATVKPAGSVRACPSGAKSGAPISSHSVAERHVRRSRQCRVAGLAHAAATAAQSAVSRRRGRVAKHRGEDGNAPARAPARHVTRTARRELERGTAGNPRRSNGQPDCLRPAPGGHTMRCAWQTTPSSQGLSASRIASSRAVSAPSSSPSAEAPRSSTLAPPPAWRSRRARWSRVVSMRHRAPSTSRRSARRQPRRIDRQRRRIQPHEPAP